MRTLIAAAEVGIGFGQLTAIVRDWLGGNTLLYVASVAAAGLAIYSLSVLVGALHNLADELERNFMRED